MKRADPPRSGLRAAWLLPLLASCSIPLADSAPSVSNECQTTSDCGGVGVCYPLDSGSTCVSASADLSDLIVEVRPAPGATYGAGISHLFRLADLGVSLQGEAPTGFVVPLGLTLGRLVKITPGQVIAQGDFAPPCMKEDHSIPAKVEFRPVTPFVGLSLDPVSATTSELPDMPGFSFDLEVPSGDYDVYVQPDPCTKLPPFFLKGRAIDENTGVHIETQAPSRLTGTLEIPTGASVEAFSLDIVEPTNGLVISDVQTLVAPKQTKLVPFDLHYYWLDQAASPVIRLRPPAGTAAPRVYWDLAAAALFGDKDVKLTLKDLDATPKHIKASVLDENHNPVLATVTIQSKELSGEAGLNASYTVTTETGADGQFEADLLLGKYRVLARPKVDATKALALGDWTVNVGDLCCGRVITVVDKAVLRGAALTAAGQAMVGASILAEPPLPDPLPYLSQELGLAPVLPDKASTLPDAGGAFALGVDPDPGVFDFSVDFSVRPLDESGFPWLVRPRLVVQQTGTNLGALRVPYPAVVHGVIRDPSGATVGAATVRAWLPIANGNAGAKTMRSTVIQIGETQTDGQGSYTLPLPPSISR